MFGIWNYTQYLAIMIILSIFHLKFSIWWCWSHTHNRTRDGKKFKTETSACGWFSIAISKSINHDRIKITYFYYLQEFSTLNFHLMPSSIQSNSFQIVRFSRIWFSRVFLCSCKQHNFRRKRI